VALYKQALGYGLFEKMKVPSMIAFGVAPHAIGKDHPQGIIGGVHSKYYFNYPPANRLPLNTAFVKKYFERWIGAVVFNYLKTYAVGLAVYWQLLLGVVLIVLVLALPSGIVGTLARLTTKLTRTDAT